MNIANHLSLIRILLAPVFVGALLYYESSPLFYWLGLATFIVACVTDAVDGYLAKKLNQRTVLGSYIDPIADKLLLVSGFLSLSLIEHLPPAMRIPGWVTIPVITRDVVILLGATAVFITTGSFKAEPLYIGKVTTFFQMLTLLISLSMAPAPLRLVLFTATVILTLLSGIFYIRVGNKILQK